ncbi:MAG: ABC transporter ATP-binding protein, partial [Dermatophilaceae bacterium]|nr:ABC transporter ATP-binding protein [Dermatophilaceae bacterium]
IIRVLSTEPDVSDGPDHRDPAELVTQLVTQPVTQPVDQPVNQPAAGVPLTDPASNVTIRPGEMTAIVSARPEESGALADRLGRFGRTCTAVHLDGVAIADLPLATVRRRIVVSEIDPRLFTGSLREGLDPRGNHTDATILSALLVASGEDVMEALPAGLDSDVEERGRSFSGGQRQRLALTRALLTNAETLVLVEPTSAVDAHTEARIAARLAIARAGRTTVVMTASPLLLDQADTVILLTDGQATAQGTHQELLATSTAYRHTVVRGEAS